MDKFRFYDSSCSIRCSENLSIAENTKYPYYQRIIALSKHWKSNEKYILDIFKNNPKSCYSPYIFDYSTIFTPIEMMAWSAIKCVGCIPFYPQYPVCGYIVDFGNPFFKIAIELDGKDYHLDKSKDHKRDDKIIKSGWEVFRITGSSMYNHPSKSLNEIEDMLFYGEINEYEYEELVSDFFNTGWGFFQSIKMAYNGTLDNVINEYSIVKYYAIKCLMDKNVSKKFDVLKIKR